MKKYAFIVKLTANDSNDNFKGCVEEYIYGKGNTLDHVGKGEYNVYVFTLRFGYDRKCDAVRQMNWHKQHLIEKFWDKEYKLVELEFSVDTSTH